MYRRILCHIIKPLMHWGKKIARIFARSACRERILKKEHYNMRYQFIFRNTTKDFWKLNNGYTYSSLVGTVNIVFTLSMLGLLLTSLNHGWTLYGIFAGIAFLYFPLIQQIFVYRKAKRQAAAITEDTRLSFTDKEIFIEVGDQHQTITWKNILAIKRVPTFTVLYTGKGNGFVIPNHAIGDKEKVREFILFCADRIKEVNKKNEKK